MCTFVCVYNLYVYMLVCLYVCMLYVTCIMLYALIMYSTFTQLLYIHSELSELIYLYIGCQIWMRYIIYRDTASKLSMNTNNENCSFTSTLRHISDVSISSHRCMPRAGRAIDAGIYVIITTSCNIVTYIFASTIFHLVPQLHSSNSFTRDSILAMYRRHNSSLSSTGKVPTRLLCSEPSSDGLVSVSERVAPFLLP